jgi:hypothetical protein
MLPLPQPNVSPSLRPRQYPLRLLHLLLHLPLHLVTWIHARVANKGSPARSTEFQLPKRKQMLRPKRRLQRRRFWLIPKSHALARMLAVACNTYQLIRYEP